MLLILTMFVLGLTSCEEMNSLTKLDLPLSTTLVVPEFADSLSTSPYVLRTPKVEAKVDEFLVNNGVQESSIEKVVLKSLKIEILSPSNGSFDFLNSMEVYLVEDTVEVKIASVSSVPQTGLKFITMEPVVVDLKPYILRNNFYLKFVVDSKSKLYGEHSFSISPVFEIGLKLFSI